MLTKQEIYDKVCAHLAQQKVRATESLNGSFFIQCNLRWRGCRYRTSNGLKCAIGCLIPDDLYSSDMEKTTLGGGAIDSVFITRFGLEKILNVEDASFMRRLQMVHDAPNSGPEDIRQAPECTSMNTSTVSTCH